MKIPHFVYTNIASIDEVDDGDRWPLMDGWSVEYRQQPIRIIDGHAICGDFIVRHLGVQIAVLSTLDAEKEC